MTGGSVGRKGGEDGESEGQRRREGGEEERLIDCGG